ncbi:MAG: hypothetical protein ACYCVZ_05210 [Streptosporangiaceae bacterium]
MPIIPDPDAAAVVRRQPCSRCGAPPGIACQVSPSADHLQRWFDAYTARLITRDAVAGVIRHVVVITKWCLVPAPASERAA